MNNTTENIHSLLARIQALEEENARLRAKLDIPPNVSTPEVSPPPAPPESNMPISEITPSLNPFSVDNHSSPEEKIAFF